MKTSLFFIKSYRRITHKKRSDINQRIRQIAPKKKKQTNYGEFSPNPNGGYTDRFPRTVQKFNTVNSSQGVVHPTQKPVTLFEYLIKTYSNEGDVILDNCIGSGTTAIAAINTNRNYIGIEQDADYVAIARHRVADINGGERP